MTGRGSKTITVREALRLLWEADCYPRIGNEDWRVADRMKADALARAEAAIASPNDPPEFARWIAALSNPSLSLDEQEEIYGALHEYFDPEG
jgi:hypothetical protein